MNTENAVDWGNIDGENPGIRLNDVSFLFEFSAWWTWNAADANNNTATAILLSNQALFVFFMLVDLWCKL